MELKDPPLTLRTQCANELRVGIHPADLYFKGTAEVARDTAVSNRQFRKANQTARLRDDVSIATELEQLPDRACRLCGLMEERRVDFCKNRHTHELRVALLRDQRTALRDTFEGDVAVLRKNQLAPLKARIVTVPRDDIAKRSRRRLRKIIRGLVAVLVHQERSKNR